MPRDQEKLERLLDRGDQGEYEAELQRKRERRTRQGRAERNDARQREDALESFLDSLDID